jgi:SOS response regulatory protein OraA/RecX
LVEGRSATDVTRRLTTQGLAEDVAEAAVDAEVEATGHDDEAAARALVLKRKLVGVKAARFLASRGFDEDVILRVVDLGQ